MVTGPGNAYLTAAKRLLRGLIGIDAEAGPTEIAVLADDTADPVHVAADLVSQAEHDPSAASVLVTTSDALADAVDAELERQVAATKHTERIRTALTGPQSGTILVARRRGRARGRRRLRGRAPGDPDGAGPRGRAAGAQRRGDLHRAVGAGVARRLLRRGRTTCCPPAAARGTPQASRCRPSCAACTSSSTPKTRCARWRTGWSPSPPRKTSRRTGRP